jgi:ABC-2 type transport system permease protein
VRNYWWPIFVILIASIAVSVLALYLGTVRDLGAGLLPARPGKRTASRMLNSPLGLSIRMLRGSVITWAIIVLVLCAVTGSLFGDLESLVGDNEMMAAFFAKADFTIVEEFLTLLTAIIAVISTVPSVSFLMKLRVEEKHGYTEHLLARSVDKGRMFAGNFGLAVLNAVLLSIIGTVSLWAIASATIDNVPALSTILLASFHYIPAIWVLVGLSAALIGLFPKATGIAYGYSSYCFIAMFTVMMFGLPEWIARLSPYAYVPQVPVESGSPVVAVVLIGISAALSVAGFMGYKKRDAVFY